MKKTNLILLFISIFMLSITSCSKDDDPILEDGKENTETPGNGSGDDNDNGSGEGNGNEEGNGEGEVAKKQGTIIVSIGEAKYKMTSNVMHGGKANMIYDLFGPLKPVDGSKPNFTDLTIYFSLSALESGDYKVAGVDCFLGNEHRTQRLIEITFAVTYDNSVMPVFYKLPRETMTETIVQVVVNDSGDRVISFKGDLNIPLDSPQEDIPQFIKIEEIDQMTRYINWGGL